MDLVEEGDQADLVKRAHSRVNETLTKICNTVRKLKLENFQLRDRAKAERRMQGAEATSHQTEISSESNNGTSIGIVADIAKNSHESGYGTVCSLEGSLTVSCLDIAILQVLIAKIQHHLKVDLQWRRDMCEI